MMIGERQTGNVSSFSRVPLVFPGLGLCGLVTVAAYLLQATEVRLVGRPWLEALVFAILFGVAVRSTWTPSHH